MYVTTLGIASDKMGRQSNSGWRYGKLIAPAGDTLRIRGRFKRGWT